MKVGNSADGGDCEAAPVRASDPAPGATPENERVDRRASRRASWHRSSASGQGLDVAELPPRKSCQGLQTVMLARHRSLVALRRYTLRCGRDENNQFSISSMTGHRLPIRAGKILDYRADRCLALKLLSIDTSDRATMNLLNRADFNIACTPRAPPASSHVAANRPPLRPVPPGSRGLLCLPADLPAGPEDACSRVPGTRYISETPV